MKREMRDRRGKFSVDPSRHRVVEEAIPGRVEFIPFDPGDARVKSLPAELFITAAGSGGKVDRGLVALRIGDVSFHRAFDVAELKILADAFGQMAALIETGK